ncbi:MAG: hypothetical protein IPM82_25485 [Saprospiraceae bacterium]|nr:hypothetical protein [Saprospiraceae bacterium]
MKNVPIPVKFVQCVSSKVLISLMPEGKTQEISANDFVRKVEEGKFELVNWSNSQSKTTRVGVASSNHGNASQAVLSH